MHLAIEIFTVYAIYIFGTSLLIWRYSTKERGVSIIVAGVTPILLVVSLFDLLRVTLFRQSRHIRPCPTGLDEAELIVEKRRQQMFGGEALQPHFASDWTKLYQETIERETVRVQKIAHRMLTVTYRSI
jgi:hypothetical protein